MTQKAARAARDAGVLAVGGLVAYAGFLALLAAVVLGPGGGGPRRLAGGAAGRAPSWPSSGRSSSGAGSTALKREELAPRQTVETLKEDAQWAKEQVASREPAPGTRTRCHGPETGQTPETAAIRGDIEQTRAEMAGTIDAIQEKLDPEVLQEQAKDTIREAKTAAVEVADHALQQAKEAVRGATIGKVEDMARYAGDTAGGWRATVMATVKAHPIPAALAGLSLGYLLLNRERSPGALDPPRRGTPWLRRSGRVARGRTGPRRLPSGGPAPAAPRRDGESLRSADRAGALAEQAPGRRRAGGGASCSTPPARRPSRSRRPPGRWPTRCRSRPTGRRASWAASWRRTPSPSAPSPSCWGAPWGRPSAPRPARTASSAPRATG